jgi:ribosomal protein S18 acetylase RimI-like enzyme
MIIRFAESADAPAISELNDVVQRIHTDAEPLIFKEPSGNSFPPAEIVGLLEDPNNIFLIAEEDERPIGYLMAEIMRRPASSLLHSFDRLYIHQLAVRESEQARGCGRALIERALTLAKERGLSAVVLDVWSFNERAKSFFEHRGFRVFNERMWIRLGDE